MSRARRVPSARPRPVAVATVLLAGLVGLAGCGGGGASDEAPPPPPADVEASAGLREVTVRWSPVRDAASYAVYLSTSPTLTPLDYGVTPNGFHAPGVEGTAFTFLGLAPATTYWAIVTARNDAGEGRPTTPVAATLPPSSPSIGFARGSFERVVVAWTPVEGATSYDLYVAADADLSSANFATRREGAVVRTNDTEVAVTGLANGRPYTFVAVALAPGARSPDSRPVTATPTARGTFLNPTDAAVGTSPSALASTDFDEDGRADVAVANRGAGTVSVLRGDGLGGLGSRSDVAVGGAPVALCAGDVNGDRHQDLVALDTTARRVVVALGDGRGAFGAPLAAAVGASPTSLAVADLDRDGRADVVVTDASAGVAYTMRALASGALASPVGSAVGASPAASLLADVNGDGRLDLVAPASGRVTTRTGDGAGGLPARLDSTLTGAFTAAVPYDLSRDGKADLVAFDALAGGCVALLGNGDGTFYGFGVVARASTLTALVRADLTGDGTDDLVGLDATTARLTVWHALPKIASFEEAVARPTRASPAAIVVVDLDRDGRPDAVVANGASNTVSIFRGAS